MVRGAHAGSAGTDRAGKIHIDVLIDQVRAELSANRNLPLDELLEHLLTALDPPRADDVVLFVVRVAE